MFNRIRRKGTGKSGWMTKSAPHAYHVDTEVADDGEGQVGDTLTSVHSEPNVSAVPTNKTIGYLRAAVVVLLLVTATIVCVGVYKYTRNDEESQFEREYDDSAHKVIESFHDAVERRLGAINSLATQITSYALDTNKTFPFVTIPNFAVRGSDLRIQADAVTVHWIPLVTDATRSAWEEYALENRFHIDEAFDEDAHLRNKQDEDFALVEEGGSYRRLQEPLDADEIRNETILDDSTRYHPRIWSIGSIEPRGDAPEGKGPYLPLWQRSPISGAKQFLLNMDWGVSFILEGALDILLETKEAVMNRIAFPIPSAAALFRASLQISQYRHTVDSFVDHPHTFFAYPVFDSFGEDRQFVGGKEIDKEWQLPSCSDIPFCTVLATNIFWKLMFESSRNHSAADMVVVVENSFNQTFSYLLDGSDPIYLGEGDAHDGQFEDFERLADVNSDVEGVAHPQTRAYTAVPLNRDYGKYKLRVYPASGPDYSNRPWVYTVVVASTFAFTTFIYIMFALAVEKRQNEVMETALRNAQRAATTAQELNEFLSHEVRNPLSAAISACSLVNSAVTETKHINNEDFKKTLHDDVQIVLTSLSFVNDFLRGMLDMHRAAGNQIQLKLAPVEIATDVLQPISTMLYNQATGVRVLTEGTDNLFVTTDCLRLKQVVLNLGRNSAKFVENGFIRFRSAVVEGKIEIYVEDSGPGIPADKRLALFEKFQTSLDVLGQGTGIGLSLCKMLVELLDGQIFLDESYDSGIDGSPGSRFVIRLNSRPLNAPLDASTRMSQHFLQGGDEGCVVMSNESMELPECLSVLFVDDDLVLRKLFSRAIRKVAPLWKIREAANGETAIRLATAEQFDIIFVDQYMASTEKQLLGTETVRELRSRGVASTLCGLSANDLEYAFISAGANAFIMKPMPCEENELRRELRRISCTVTSNG